MRGAFGRTRLAAACDTSSEGLIGLRPCDTDDNGAGGGRAKLRPGVLAASLSLRAEADSCGLAEGPPSGRDWYCLRGGGLVKVKIADAGVLVGVL